MEINVLLCFLDLNQGLKLGRFYRECNENEKKTQESHCCQPISALDFAYALANHRPELILGECVSQSAARLQKITHHMSKPCKTFLCSSDFHD